MKFFKLDERLEDVVFIRNHLDFETSDSPVPADSYLSITQGQSSAEALELLIREVRTQFSSDVMELLLEEYDFELSEPLTVGYKFLGNINEPGLLKVEALLLEPDEPSSNWIMEDGEIGGIVRGEEVDYMQDLTELPKEFREELHRQLTRREIRVEARLDVAGIMASLIQRRDR